jgi:hypothetical protein
LTVRNAAACLFTRLDQHFAGLDSTSNLTYDISPILDDLDPQLPDNDQSQILSVSNLLSDDELTPDSHLITRPTAVVYKGAQLGISAKWADQRKDLSLSVCFCLFLMVRL